MNKIFFVRLLLRGHPCGSNAGAVGNLKEETGVTVSCRSLVCCNKKVKNAELWILKDIKGFEARKMFVGFCTECKNKVVTLVETRIEDKKTFVDNLVGIEAVKTIFREKKRKIETFSNMEVSKINGWIYGKNVEIKNRKGETTKIRQYATDYSTNKKNLVKAIFVS